ncbi:MAG: hypothetical protein EXS08_16055 [Planctomycetes bacterium]|nr:hypothetical protein [Planctomycetota bacterium]
MPKSAGLRASWCGLGIVLCAVALSPARGDERQRFDPAQGRMQLVAVQSGFGQLLPHRVPVPDANGFPTAEIAEITKQSDLALIRTTNPVLPVASWPSTALLPNGQPGNHYLYARFSRSIDVDSVLTSAVTATAVNQLLERIQVVTLNPFTGATSVVRGRVFLAGQTYGPVDPADPSRRSFQRWVELDALGRPRALVIGAQRPGLGFPGTQGGTLAGASALLDDRSLVFVVDSDGDLSTHETFPVNRQIQLRIQPGVRSLFGEVSAVTALASATVGADGVHPEVQVSFPSQEPLIEPPNGTLGVDPLAHVFVRFTEPLQPFSIGALEGSGPPAPSLAIQLVTGPVAAQVSIPFGVRFPSVFDLGRAELVPAYPFPGSSGGGLACSPFSAVEVHVQPNQLADLVGNRNLLAPQSFFQAAEGRALVNAPVTPDAIYVARGNALSVLDLNGFGQSTGDPTFDLAHPIVQGNSNFPNNPNVALQGSGLRPPLAPGTCTFNGGSAGAFTLTKNSALSDELIGFPELSSVGDMALGHALDAAFDDGAPFGCQAGGGNLCAATGLKLLEAQAGGPNSIAPAITLPPLFVAAGAENPVSWAPHPNPPPLVYPPLCLTPFLLGQEPTSIDSTLPPPRGFNLTNLLVPGPFPLGIPAIELPPQGTLALELNAFFQGPSPAQPFVAQCTPFSIRQKIGQFLYVVDRVAGEIVVLDSNRMLVLDRIALVDPTALAMSPNVDLLAVSQEGVDQVSFVDIDPASPTFHQVVHTTAVGQGPLGLAWEPGNEDILVCNRGEGTVSVLSAFTLEVRKTVQAGGKVRGADGRFRPGHFPFEVAITPRQTQFGFVRGVYFAYILNVDGTLSVFESGPDGVNGFGYDDIVATLPFPFHRPKALQVMIQDTNSSVYVLHEDPLDASGQLTGQAGGALTNVGIIGGLPGVMPLGLDASAPPHLRQLLFGVIDSLGEGARGLSGIPVDLAFDDQRNLGALPNAFTAFSAGSPVAMNGKGLMKNIGIPWPASAPAFLFLAVPTGVPSAGVVDVFDLLSGALERVDTDPFLPGTQSIPAPGVSGVMNYFRQ